MNTYLQNKFEIFLRDIFKLINHKVPYFIRWIEKYLEFAQKVEHNSESSLSNNDKLKFLEKFLQRLSSMHPDCQVDQADQAVRYYLSFLEKSKSSSKNVREIDSSWYKLVFDSKKEMRLQNKSLKTEHSYIYWIKQFAKFENNKRPGDVNEDGVKSFLTYLAIEREVAIST